MEQVVYNHLQGVSYLQVHDVKKTARLKVSSQAFAFNARLPIEFTADGEGISPPLTWDAAPAEAALIAIIVEDADSPTPHPLVHAIVVNIPRTQTSLALGALTKGHQAADVEIGRNSFFDHAWLPPDPPPGHGEHRYVFQVFALRAGPTLSKSTGRREFVDAVLTRALAAGCLIGTYERSARETIEITEPIETGVLSEKPSTA
jgi:Raf kinase inhibitor-like YbhB/YbcL family protein